MIWKPSYLTREQLEVQQVEAGRLLKAGKLSQAEIARQLSVSRAKVSDWANKSRRHASFAKANSHLQRHVPGKIILIWDRARIPISKKVRTYLCDHAEIQVELLPAYAPELNTEEYCHGNVKQGLKNARPTCKSEMRSLLDRGFARLRHRPDLFLSFFHRAGPSVRLPESYKVIPRNSPKS